MKLTKKTCLIIAIFIVVAVSVVVASTNILQLADIPKTGNPKLDNSLNDIIANPSQSKYSTERYDINNGNYSVKVIIDLKEYRPEYIEILKNNGAKIQISDGNLVQALVEVSKLDAIANLPFVDNVRKPAKYRTSVVSEGVNTINASVLHNAGYNGSGIKIGIVDLGFQGYLNKLGTELPPSVTVESFSGGGIENGVVHGTAVAEVIHDVAPGAQLFLTNFDTDLELNKSVNWLLSQNVSIISMSAGKSLGPKDGTDYIDEVINKAVQSGIFWTNSAGNEAMKHWTGNFNDPDNDGLLNFSGVDQTQDIYTLNGYNIEILLDWNDWPKSSQDYDIYLFDNNGNLLGSSTATQNGTQSPFEYIEYTASYTGVYQIVIFKYDATKDVKFHLYVDNAIVKYNIQPGSVSIPTTDSSFMVGATDWPNDILEYYSSQGPTDDGRIKPDIVAPANVTNSVYGNFAGTSASAPHMAGAAALLQQMNPNLNRTELKQALENGAKDLGDLGKDNKFGIGRIDINKSASIISILGDINEDKKITASDALLYLRYAVGQDISPYQIGISDDVTCDERITAADALKVLKKAVGQNVNFGC